MLTEMRRLSILLLLALSSCGPASAGNSQPESSVSGPSSMPLSGAAAGTSANPWRLEDNSPSLQFEGISCPTIVRCWVVGNGPSGAVIMSTSDGGAHWSKQTPPVNLGTTPDLHEISCTDPLHCWAVGQDVGGPAEIIATRDGGATWSGQSYPADTGLTNFGNLESIVCPTLDHCWAAGANRRTSTTDRPAVLLATADGGTTTWTQQAYPPDSGLSNGEFLQVTCADGDHCWAVGDTGGAVYTGATPVILSTVNGGGNWVSQSPPAGTASQVVQSISCPTVTTCWAIALVATTGPVLIWQTADGGGTWVDRTPSSLGLSLGGTRINRVSCPTPTDCWAVGNSATGGAMIAATVDGGATWTSQILPAVNQGTLTSIQCKGASACWIAGISFVLAAVK
jgi:photosystem II stability/assembly factor-like uncharacterized protein